MKKFLYILLIISIVFSLPLAVGAEESSELSQLLTESCTSGTEVDISRFDLDEDRLDAAYVDVWYSGKLPWNITSYSYRQEEDGKIISFIPTFYDQAEYDYNLYNQKVYALLDQIRVANMTQWEMALAVHDYLAVNSVYDETLERNTNYDLLVNGTAVCTGYAMAYMDIMNRLGVECRFVESQPMLHAWNLIKIDGNWYHVDVTHDDPTPDSCGYVSHERFLKTDKEMEQLGYHDWDTDITCTDETFIDPLWENVSSMILFTDEAMYLRVKNDFDYTVMCQPRDLTVANTTLFDIPAQALTLEEDAYHYENNGLSLWDGRLWFSGVDRVWSVAKDGSDLQTVFRYNVEEKGKFIYSSFVKDGVLYLTLSDGQYQLSNETVTLTNSAEHTHDYIAQTKESTCTEAGGTVYVCQCGASYDGEMLPLAEHTYDSYISKQATCQEDGEKTYLCSVCGDSYTETYSDPDAHSYESSIVEEATFFKEGIKHLTCRLCGFTTYESLKKLSFQKQFGLTVWSTISVIALFVCIPILICSSQKKKK